MLPKKADQIAERILMLGGKPENRFSEYLRVAKVKEVSGVTRGDEAIGHILTTYSYLIGEERKLLELASEAGDEATVALMRRLPEGAGEDGLDADRLQQIALHRGHRAAGM